MLGKAVILILLYANAGHNPVSVQAGAYPSTEDCQNAGTAFIAASMASGKTISATCLVTPWPFVGRDA